ncbi:hypothetical protein DFQ29_009270 [Apophysomyces sp. BC1021]|nr:hypothetical protein DFQ29_009270 [Apophysomyces sp. BC1021]
MAAFGAKGIQGSILNVSSLYEYRGVSFAAGGDGNVSTVPNFIKRYNPRLLGASVGEHLVEYCEGLRDYPGTSSSINLNVGAYIMSHPVELWIDLLLFIFTAYNEQLRKNSKKYNLYNDQDFAVMFSPSPRLVQATLIAFIQAPKDMNGLQG